MSSRTVQEQHFINLEGMQCRAVYDRKKRILPVCMLSHSGKACMEIRNVGLNEERHYYAEVFWEDYTMRMWLETYSGHDAIILPASRSILLPRRTCNSRIFLERSSTCQTYTLNQLSIPEELLWQHITRNMVSRHTLIIRNISPRHILNTALVFSIMARRLNWFLVDGADC